MSRVIERPRIERNEHGKYRVDGRLRCDCGRVVFYGWSDTRCECGANYNACGQRLVDDAHLIPDYCDTEEQVEAWRASREEY